MKKYDLCVKSGTYTDRNGNEKVNWENVGVMMENGNGPYILIKPWVNFAGFPREEGRTHLFISVFEHKENDQRSSRNNEREDFSTPMFRITNSSTPLRFPSSYGQVQSCNHSH